MSKLDIKEGFWRIFYAKVQEWNFTYIMPNRPVKPTEIVVPLALQMGQALSTIFLRGIRNGTGCGRILCC